MTETGEQKSNKIGGSRSLWKKSFAVNLLIKVHLAIHLSDTDDVRPTLQHYSQFGNPMVEFRLRAQELAAEDQSKGLAEDKLLKRYSGTLFGFRRHSSA